MGPFISRNMGAYFAKGEYIQFVDGDDLLVNDILAKTYEIAINKNVDIVQYSVIRGINSFTLKNEKTKNGIIQAKLLWRHI